MTTLSFTIPLVPVSVNHYKVRTRKGHTYVTEEARDFKEALAIFARGGFVEGKSFYVSLTITLGEGDRGDVDNFSKLVLDGLAECGAFRDIDGRELSDNCVTHLEIKIDRKSRPKEGYTTLLVKPL
jgi:Holliday junction resolvase RusA-like endonuclease